MKKLSNGITAFAAAVLFAAVFSAERAIAGEGLKSGILKDVGIEVYTGWESKYSAEGRNDLARGGIYVFGTSLGYKGFSAAFDYIGGDKENYSEVNLGVGYGVEAGGFEFSAGYTRLEFIHDNTKDNELSGEAGYGGFPFASASAAIVYSTEAEGSFLEFTTSVEIPKFFGLLTVSPYALQSFDFGYRTKENDGANNFQFGVEAVLDLTEKVSLAGRLSHSVKQKDVREEIKSDDEAKAAGTWGGVSLAVTL